MTSHDYDGSQDAMTDDQWDEAMRAEVAFEEAAREFFDDPDAQAEYAEWAGFFAASALKRQAVAAGAVAVVNAREADDLVREASAPQAEQPAPAQRTQRAARAPSNKKAPEPDNKAAADATAPTTAPATDTATDTASRRSGADRKDVDFTVWSMGPRVAKAAGCGPLSER